MSIFLLLCDVYCIIIKYIHYCGLSDISEEKPVHLKNLVELLSYLFLVSLPISKGLLR